MTGYDFSQLYGQADNSNFLYPEAPLDAVVESAEWGRTKDGTKGQWTVKVRISTGENAGKMPIIQNITVTADNPRSLGIMFRHLAALGIPVPDPQNPQVCVNGTQPFWMMGWSEEQVAQAMTGKPVTVVVKHEDFDGVTRNKIKDFRPPRPGAPTTWPQTQSQPAAGQSFTLPGFAAPGQPVPGQAQFPGGYPAQQYNPAGGQVAPGPWNGQPANMPGTQPPAPAQQPWAGQTAQFPGHVTQPEMPPVPQQQMPQQQMPDAPPWSQPAVPGAGGTGEFTQQGQSYQPSVPGAQPPWAGQPAGQYPQQQQAPQGQPADAAPPLPPWAQQ